MWGMMRGTNLQELFRPGAHRRDDRTAAAGMPTAEMCRRHGPRPASFSGLRSEDGGMESARPKGPGGGDSRLARLLAGTMPDNAVLKDLPGKRRRHRQSGERSRCRCRPRDGREMREIAGKRRRFGCRRIGVPRERKGMIANRKDCPASTGKRALR